MTSFLTVFKATVDLPDTAGNVAAAAVELGLETWPYCRLAANTLASLDRLVQVRPGDEALRVLQSVTQVSKRPCNFDSL